MNRNNIDRNDYEYDPEEEYLLNGTMPDVAGLATPRFAESRKGFVEEFESLLDQRLAEEESNVKYLSVIAEITEDDLVEHEGESDGEEV